MNTYIIGHQKPDTDAVVAAIALEHLFKAKDCFGYQNPQAVITDPINPETQFIFNKFGIDTPQQVTSKDIASNDQVVLVDHNEEHQRLSGLNPDQIVEIVDHHKINLNLNTPIFTTFKAWGSSSTIVYYIMKQNDFTPDKNLASIMLAAILSDTVGFKSATTTDKDQEIGQELAKLAQITNLDTFTLEIFKAKSNVSQLTDEEIVTNDYKLFDFNQKVFINQIETVEQDVILSKKTALLKAMETIKQQQSVDLVFCAITDILKVNTKLLFLGEQEAQIAEKAFGGKAQDNLIDIGPKLSRKKEIAPPIEQAIS